MHRISRARDSGCHSERFRSYSASTIRPRSRCPAPSREEGGSRDSFAVLPAGLLTMNRRARRGSAWAGAGDRRQSGYPGALYADPQAPGTWPDGPGPQRPWSQRAGPAAPVERPRRRGPGPPRRRRIPLWVKGGAAVILAGLIFRRAIASVILMALSASLHFLGFNVHLPDIK